MHFNSGAKKSAESIRFQGMAFYFAKQLEYKILSKRFDYTEDGYFIDVFFDISTDMKSRFTEEVNRLAEIFEINKYVTVCHE
jgi:hypothetical protein